MTDPVFEVTYGCKNCGNEWSEEHPPRVNVRDSTSGKNTRVTDADCNTLGVYGCDCCYYVECSVCELRDDVYVEDRTPITDGDSDD